MKVYTKRGDDGTTGLLYGGRVDKDDLRTSAYGTVDECVSALGLARAHLSEGEWHDAILAVQRELFAVGAQLATHADKWHKLQAGISCCTDDMVTSLEERIDAITDRYPLPGEFIVPGATPAGSAVDMGRSICRRAERQVVAMNRENMLPNEVPLRYLNRLSDYLFVLARAVEDGAHTPSRVS